MNGLLARTLPYLLAFFSSFCIMILELVASRLVARHVGASLTVWTSVIGVMLGGICLGNVFGGRLADRVEPGRAVGPLYALGALLTLGCLWVNAYVGLLPGMDSLSVPWTVRTMLVVTLDFLVPATVLGMIGPVVAKIAVEQARKAGSAIGDIYFFGAVGSICGTFLAGFYLMYYAPVSTIVTIVAAALALLAAVMMVRQSAAGLVVGLLAAACLGAGSVPEVVKGLPAVLTLGASRINPVVLAGHVLTVVLGLIGLARLNAERRAADASRSPADEGYALAGTGGMQANTTLADLALLSFIASLSFMALEMAAGRMVSRHLGTSVYGWTSIIGVLLGGLSVGNYLGGKIANAVRHESQASWLFLVASVFTVGILFMEKPPKAVADRLAVVGFDLRLMPHVKELSDVPTRGKNLIIVADVDGILRFRLFGPNGKTIADVSERGVAEKPGQTEALRRQFDRLWPPHEMSWGEKSSVISTVAELVGYTEGSDKPVLSRAISMTHFPWVSSVSMTWPWRVLLVVTAVFFLPSVAMGTFSPVVAKLAVERLRRSKQTGRAIGQVYAWGMVGSILGTFLAGYVLIDLIGTKGLLLALATVLALSATALGTVWHAAWAGIPLGLCVIAFAPFPWFEKQGLAWGIREEKGVVSTQEDALAWVDESNYYYIKVTNEPDDDGSKRTLVLDNLIHGYFILGHPERLDYDYEHIYALVAHRVAAARAKAAGKSNPSQAKLSTLFLGGGAYCFQRYMQHKYPETAVDVAEIDPAVTRANHLALGLPKDTPIKTYFGDARQFVERNQGGRKQYDIVFGDAFSDFSVPWHLTTREFNDKLARMMGPEGVYMINIIDAYESDQKSGEKADAKIVADDITSEDAKKAIFAAEKRRGHRYGGFLGAWVKTARLTFPYIYIFGTDDEPGSGLRETFVVVASKTDLKLDDPKSRLGSLEDDPQFKLKQGRFEPIPFGESDRKAIDSRARGIVLTDDYAPVENLLAPVAETRGDDD